MKNLLKRLFDIARLKMENDRLRVAIARAIQALDNDNPDTAERILDEALRQ